MGYEHFKTPKYMYPLTGLIKVFRGRVDEYARMQSLSNELAARIHKVSAKLRNQKKGFALAPLDSSTCTFQIRIQNFRRQRGPDNVFFVLFCFLSSTYFTEGRANLPRECQMILDEGPFQTTEGNL